jgi:eukaryotic-like serine/threonine-protein kinase
MNEKPDPTESIFAAAAALGSAAERAAYLDQACAGDAALRAHVEALLRAHERASHLLDRPAVGSREHTEVYRPNEQPGDVIAGRYKLLQRIGEGGMGTVWVVEQTHPVRRKVALKLIKAGMDSKSVLARFEAERQALAVMDHANIAKVLDGGLTETGRPFFVMEYVKGVPITEYCDATRLSVPERLNLFVQVCQAVQHAHQKGIIHRDLKPSNILVAPYDDKPVPKVIDFGLAKAMHQSLTERTLHTAHETVLGTPLYMSPEQAQLNNLDVDTRSDIYSLGVLLYELLTGTTPLEKKQFKEAAWEEMKRLIREEEPPRPSTRLSSTNTLPSLAAGRQTEPAKLTKLVRGDLDWIVMKSLEKDRTRRYETANGFAMDIERYLAGEPVLAAPPGARYRLRKFAWKHRAALGTAAALAFLLVAGVAVSTWQAVRATRAEEAAVQAQRAAAERAEGERLAKLESQNNEKLAGERLVQVEAEKQKADEEKQVAQAVKDFLQYKLLAQANTWTQANALLKAGESSSGAKANPTIRELLDRAAKELAPDRIGESFPNRPLVQAEILQTMGGTYLGLGEYQPASDFLKRSEVLRRQHLGPEHPDRLNTLSTLAQAYHGVGKLDLALPLFEETLSLRKAKLGREHPATLVSMSALALAYQTAGKLDLALPLFQETLRLSQDKLGAEHPATLISMSHLANAYSAAAKLDLARALLEEAVKLFKDRLGPEHPETLVGMNNLAEVYQAAGELDLAVLLFEETLKLRKSKLGLEHPATLTSMNNLARAYQAAGKLDLALPLFEEALTLLKVKLGPEHPATLMGMNNLALAHLAAAARQAWLGRDLELAATCGQALELAKESNDPITLERVAKACSLSPSANTSRLAVSLLLARKAVELGKGHQLLPWLQLALGMAEYRNGHFPEADEALIAAHIAPYGAFYRAMSLFRQGKTDEARQLATAAAATLQPPPNDAPDLRPDVNLEDVILWLAYKEAKDLIGFDAGPAHTKRFAP